MAPEDPLALPAAEPEPVTVVVVVEADFWVAVLAVAVEGAETWPIVD